MTQLPKFTAALLHPRYWLTWSGIGLLWLIVQLPYPVIFRMGKGLGRINSAVYEASREDRVS